MLDFNIFGIPYVSKNTSEKTTTYYSAYEGLKYRLISLLQIGADICGFFNEPSEELCARWQQVGAFYPYSRNHNGNNFKVGRKKFDCFEKNALHLNVISH
jgi:Glycosyl hydrolases family 31